MKIRSVSLLAGPSLMALAFAAGAQTTAAPTSGANELEEIIVTARRKEESVQDVPISMTVFSQEQLSNQNVFNAADLAQHTPSLTANSRFGGTSSSFAIRGFIQEGPTSPSAAVYFADVVGLRANGGTTAGNGAGVGSYFDLQNVQVLKGPQGTLFGRNTTGGAILLVPQKPTHDFGGYVEASAGNYDMHRIEGALNAPIADNFRIRIGVDDNSRRGYLRNTPAYPGAPLVGPKDFADVNYTAVRVSAVWDITPDIENYTIVAWSDSHTHGYVPKMIYANPLFPLRTAANIAEVAALSNNFWDVSNGEPHANEEIKQQQVINTTTWLATDTLTVKNIASYGTFRQAQASAIYGDSGVDVGPPINYNQAISIIPGPGSYNVSQSTFTEELQLQGRPTENLTYQAGVYYELAKPLNGFQTSYTPQLIDCQDVLALLCRSTAGPSSSISISKSEYTFRNRGIFAQSTYNFTDQWALTAGVRYTSDDTTGLGQPVKVTFGPFVPAGQVGTPVFSCTNPAPLTQGGTSDQVQADPSRCNFPRQAHSKKPTWLIDLDYKPIKDVLVYAKYARGYRQGGVNVSNYGFETWGPEKVDTYEAGTKTTFRSFISGTFNISAFYNSFSDQQLQLGGVQCTSAQVTSGDPQCPFVPPAGAGIANAGKSLIKGLETETSLNLIKGLNLDLNYTYLKTVIQTVTKPAPPLGYTGSNTANAGGPIPLTPTNKFAATLNYTLPLPEGIGRITLSGNTTFQSGTLGSVSSQSSGLYQLPSQRLYNANINWNSILGQPVDLSLFSTNITERKFRTFTTGASFGFDSAILNEPRMFGARVKYSFGGGK